MITTLNLTMTDGSWFQTDKIIGFRCVKERYTPYTELTITAYADELLADVADVSLYIEGKPVHSGIMDSLTVTEGGGRRIMRISSKGFTSMLSQNELEPGLLSNINFSTLMAEKAALPNIMWQDSQETVRYIYVEEHDSQWEAIVNLSLMLNEDYPYIGSYNQVRLTAEDEPLVIVPEKIIEVGSTGDYSKMVSHYHMKDVNDEYSYNYTDGFAEERGIIRHKYIAYDRQFVALSHLGLQYRLNFTQRGCRSRFLTYSGYLGEELRDRVVFPDGTEAEISAIEICGNAKKGVFTKVYCYYDRYCNT